MDAQWPGTGDNLWPVEPYQVANEARRRLLTIRERLAELEVRRAQLSTSTANAVTLSELQSARRARLAADSAVTRAAESKVRVRKLYLHAARLHDDVACRLEVSADSSSLRADQYRLRAAWHRQAANQDRLNAERIRSLVERQDALPAVGDAAEGAQQAARR